MINPDTWLNLLCCPACRGALSLAEKTQKDPDDHIITGELRCTQCDKSYPVLRGVPRFVEKIQNEKSENTAEAFGYQWQRANDVVRELEEKHDNLFLEFVQPPVNLAYLANKVILDAGCGQGRFTLVAQRHGAAQVVGVDLSDAVEAAFANTRHLPNVLIVQGDLLSLPLRQAFDYAFSVGVLHHTEDPRRAFACVAKVVKPGGGFSAWVYGRENNGWIIHILNPIRENITSHLPRFVLWAVTYFLALILWIVIFGVYLPIYRSERLKPLGRYLFLFDYLCWLGTNYPSYRGIALVIFDHLVPEIAEYIPHDEFQSWFNENHLTDVTITSKANNSWRGFGSIPS